MPWSHELLGFVRVEVNLEARLARTQGLTRVEVSLELRVARTRMLVPLTSLFDLSLPLCFFVVGKSTQLY